jgi:hypothetical protein
VNRSIDLSGLEPLLRLLREEPPEIAIAAVEAAVRFPLTDDAWRALAQETARLLHETDETTPDRERLISAAASIPVRSVRLRLHGITENGAPQDRDRAFRALAEVGDPEVASIIVRTLEESSAEDWYWGMSRLARMPIEATNLSLEDLPVADEAFPDVRFWQALVFARLGSMNALEPVLRGHVDPPGFVWGSPWLAYAELARVRPLPEPVQAHILDMFGLRSAGEVDRDALDRAGLIVWGLTGEADAEGSPIEGAPGAEASREEAVVWSEAEVALAERAAQEILGNFEGLVDEQVDTAPLRALPPGKVGGFVHALLRIAHDFVRSMEGVPPFVVSNPVVRAISSLPRADLPVALIFEEWKAAAQSGVDPEQLAWILERGGAEQVIAAAARSKDPDFLIILSSVGDVAAGTAGSPWRGSGGGGSSGERQEIIEDIGWAESAPPPVEEVASSRALARRVVGAETGITAAGGIRSFEDFRAMMAAGATRIGASAGLEILRQAAAPAAGAFRG